MRAPVSCLKARWMRRDPSRLLIGTEFTLIATQQEPQVGELRSPKEFADIDEPFGNEALKAAKTSHRRDKGLISFMVESAALLAAEVNILAILHLPLFDMSGWE